MFSMLEMRFWLTSFPLSTYAKVTILINNLELVLRSANQRSEPKKIVLGNNRHRRAIESLGVAGRLAP
jgi:hypothetical protein